MINSGWGYDAKAKKMTYDPSRNDGLEDDARTFGILRDIANSLDQDIQMTVDVPSDFPDRRLPVLDLAIFVRDNQVHHSFYQKPMATPFVNLQRSALPAKTKRDSLFQEGIRRLRNMSEEIITLKRSSYLRPFFQFTRFTT